MNRQRNPNSPRIKAIRPLERSDLAALQAKRNISRMKNLRDSHHLVARLVATGISTTEIARRTGRSISALSTLIHNPAMKELIESYRTQVTEAWKDSTDEYYEFIYTNGLKAQRQIADHLDAADETGELLPLNRLLAIAADSADRVGYTKKTTNVNINVDFASRLEEARRRQEELNLRRIAAE